MHLGTARTALVAWLSARSSGAKFVLRIEDLDTPRVRPGAQAQLLRDLAWLGLDWDEGPDVGGPSGPYIQSQRTHLYVEALAQLTARGAVYPCSCTRKEVHAIASAPHGGGSAYPGLCRGGPLQPGRPVAIRFRYDGSEAFVDAAEGPVCDPFGPDDFIVQRTDGVFAYMLAVVVDDLAMGISEIVRGADLLSSTGKQRALARALDHELPWTAHVPLVLGPDGARLAKRHGAIAVADLSKSTTSERLVGTLAHSLGLRPTDAPTSPRALVQDFSWERLVKEAAVVEGWPGSAVVASSRP